MDRRVPDRRSDMEAFREAQSYHHSIDDFPGRKDTPMRKPRDYDSELKALEDKAKELKIRKVQQLGELVIATGADSFSAEELAGALLVLAETKDAARREAWARRGAAFFRGKSRRSATASDRGAGSAQAQSGSAQSLSGSTGAA